MSLLFITCDANETYHNTLINSISTTCKTLQVPLTLFSICMRQSPHSPANTIYHPPRNQTAYSIKEWNTLLEQSIARYFVDSNIEIIMFEGVSVYAGIIHAMRAAPEKTYIWLKRVPSLDSLTPTSTEKYFETVVPITADMQLNPIMYNAIAHFVNP